MPTDYNQLFNTVRRAKNTAREFGRTEDRMNKANEGVFSMTGDYPAPVSPNAVRTEMAKDPMYRMESKSGYALKNGGTLGFDPMNMKTSNFKKY